MEDAGYLPLIFIWRTGGLETYKEQMFYVRDGVRYEDPLIDTPLHFLADLGQGIVRAPVTYLKQLKRVLDRTFGDDGWKLDNEKNRYHGGPVTADNNVIFSGKDNLHQDAGEMIVYFLATIPRLVTSPLADGIGSTAWENMVRRARTTVHQTSEFDSGCTHAKGEELGSGGFSQVFNGLRKWLQSNDKDHELRIVLIGHSMGTIVLDELIRTYGNMDFDDIVYMGAAASIRDFNRTVVPYLRAHPGTLL